MSDYWYATVLCHFLYFDIMKTVDGLNEEEVKKLKIYLWNETRHYNFILGGFHIPKFIESKNSKWSSRTLINIENHRNGTRGPSGDLISPGLLQKRQAGEMSFIKNYKSLVSELYSESKNVKGIEQFPVFITSRKLWLECCKEAGLKKDMKDQNNISYVDRQYFVLDLYLPGPKLAYEIDYLSSHPCPEYDIARDKYNYRKYGIVTTRFVDYGKSLELTKRADMGLKKTLKDLSEQDEMRVEKFDYTSFSIDSFCLDYARELEMLRYFRSIGITNLTEKEMNSYMRSVFHLSKDKFKDHARRLVKIYEIIGSKFTIYPS